MARTPKESVRGVAALQAFPQKLNFYDTRCEGPPACRIHGVVSTHPPTRVVFILNPTILQVNGYLGGVPLERDMVPRSHSYKWGTFYIPIFSCFVIVKFRMLEVSSLWKNFVAGLGSL